MGTKKIDVLQTAQIVALEADVLELREKLNKEVEDAIAISAKLNVVIDDLNNMNEVVMEGYTTPGSPESYGILEALDVYKDKWKDHIETYGADSRADPSLPPSWDWWPPLSGSGSYNSADITGTLTGASWTSGNSAVTFTGTTGTICLGQRMINSGSEVGQPVEGPVNGAMISLNTTSPLYLDGTWYLSGSGTLSFVAKAGTIHYGTYWESYWQDLGPWNQDWFEHPRIQRAGRTAHSNSGSAGAASYDAPVVDGTGQSGNTAHSADAEDSVVVAEYGGIKESILTVDKKKAKRAKKLTRQTLNRLRK